MNCTKRNHYNPCFWTAYWNSTYLQSAIAGKSGGPKAREQLVFALNVKSGEIYETVVDNVHFDKNLGIAEITPDDAKKFCKRNFPDKYAELCRDVENNSETIYLDFENILHGLEQTPGYSTLLDVIVNQEIKAPIEKGNLTGFIIVHSLRSHAMMNAMIELSCKVGMKKFEYFWILKHLLSNTNYLYSLAMTIAPFRWHYYRVPQDTFPLNDTPVLVQPGSVMIALSPRLLLEVDRTQKTPDSTISYSNCIPPNKLEEFRQRTITNSFREIIFGNRELLEEWQNSNEFSARHKLLSNVKNYNEMIVKQGEHELWMVNALGNVWSAPK